MSRPIPHHVWRHAVTGRTASVRGAAPWSSEADKPNWTREPAGWTVEHPDGTTGLCRMPFTTEAEAQAWCDQNPAFPGLRQN
ncbi:hypothetical protein KIKIMORA_05070 [Brevundimonas phage vB_BpoS-Kikimora]|uniref:Uncharacterized protein n=1 Tax=Brevundimonas phage vB_BpoS-Kikimora TaxID=2948601 RepID=A0A9E7SL52_9CAUD|nr:hypothetical protein KIKIMORA_05070 [Brevundimonas phage vB_BpoS-Kikimora]